MEKEFREACGVLLHVLQSNDSQEFEAKLTLDNGQKVRVKFEYEVL